MTKQCKQIGSSPRALQWTAALLLAATAPMLAAQQAYRNLSGTVRDRHREALRGAVVQIENQSTHAVNSYITDRNGTYSFKRLDANTDYSVWFTYRGQQSKTRTLSSFDTNQNAVLDLSVKVEDR